jgi:hypothetical protein
MCSLAYEFFSFASFHTSGEERFGNVNKFRIFCFDLGFPLTPALIRVKLGTNRVITSHCEPASFRQSCEADSEANPVMKRIQQRDCFVENYNRIFASQ